MIDYNVVARDYKRNMELHFWGDKSGYPLDIIHDMTYILQNKPELCFFFCERYISTFIVDIIFDYKDNSKNKALLERIEHFSGRLTSLKYCNLLYQGKFHEWDLGYEFAQKDVITLLDFFAWEIAREMQVYFNE